MGGWGNFGAAAPPPPPPAPAPRPLRSGEIGDRAAAVAGEVEDWRSAETRTFFIPEDLEYLRQRGGSDQAL